MTVYDGGDAGQDDERQLQADRGGKSMPIGVVVRREVPDPGCDKHGESRPRDPAELTRGDARNVGARSAQHWYESTQRELPANPHRRSEDVQEQAQRLDVDGQHVVTLATYGDHMLLWPLTGAFIVIQLAIALVKLFALIDAASKPAGAFVYAEKKTKQFWLVVLVLALLTTLLGFLSIVGLVAALVYLLDVRPAITRR